MKTGETSCVLLMEDGTSAKLEFYVTEDTSSERPFGIQAIIESDSGTETEYANCKFFTYEEAEKTARFLCRHQVTPCTLKDII